MSVDDYDKEVTETDANSLIDFYYEMEDKYGYRGILNRNYA